MGRVGKVFLYVIYFGLVIVLAGFITHALTSDKSTPSPHHQTVATPQTAAPKPSSSPTTPAPSSSTGSSSSSSNPGLANSGPGNELAVFLGASLIGTVAYRQLLITRLKSRV